MTRRSDRTVTEPKPRFLAENPLLRVLAINLLTGTVVALMLVIGLVVTDTAHLGTLILNAEEPWIAVALLFFGLVVTLGSVAMATAIWMLPYDGESDGEGGPGRGDRVSGRPVPIRVEVRDERHPRAEVRRTRR